MVASSLLPDVEESVDTFVQDLVTEEHRVAAVWITNASETDLRDLFRDLYDDQTWSLSGAVLVGSVSYAVYGSVDDNYPCDGFYAEVGERLADGSWRNTWSDSDSDGIYDALSTPSPAEIWVSRVDGATVSARTSS